MIYRHPAQLVFITLMVLVCACTEINDEELESPMTRGQFELIRIEGISTDRASSGGVSWIDFDDDGDVDLFVSNGYDVSSPEPAPQTNRLYRNDGAGKFEAMSSGSLMDSLRYSSAHTWGDYDNDGDPDLFVTNQQDQDNQLFRNDGSGRFTAIDDEPPTSDGGHSYSAAWVDIDRDGWLDLFVANGGLSHAGANGLYRATGEGHFEKIIEGDIATDAFATCGFAWGDYDKDGDPDLFVANQGFDPSSNSNALYRNDGNWSFTKLVDSPAAKDHTPSSAATWVDVDNDQDLDLHVTTLYGLANLLYLNDGKGGLSAAADSPLAIDGGYSPEANWEDYDNDGDIDVVIANWGSGADLYLNDGQGGFVRTRGGQLGTRLHHTGALASADFDRDGDVDLYIANWPNNRGEFELNKLYANIGAAGHWLQVGLTGSESNHSAIGARVRLVARIAGENVSQIRELSSQSGFRGQSEMICHFGLGSASIVDTVEVSWPSGLQSRLASIEVDQRIEIDEAK